VYLPGELIDVSWSGQEHELSTFDHQAGR